MRLTTRRFTFASILIALGVTGYLYYRTLDAENLRLQAIVETGLTKVMIPPRSTLIYRKSSSSRSCKTADITKLFITEAAPADVCKVIYTQLNAGWKSHDGCRSIPHKSVYGDPPAYTAYQLNALNAGATPTKLLIEVNVQPQGGWQMPSYLIPDHGNEAFAIAKKYGKTFFVVRMSYIEDLSLLSSYVDRNEDCFSTLYAWRFQDGRGFSRSW